MRQSLFHCKKLLETFAQLRQMFQQMQKYLQMFWSVQLLIIEFSNTEKRSPWYVTVLWDVLQMLDPEVLHWLTVFSTKYQVNSSSACRALSVKRSLSLLDTGVYWLHRHFKFLCVTSESGPAKEHVTLRHSDQDQRLPSLKCRSTN